MSPGNNSNQTDPSGPPFPLCISVILTVATVILIFLVLFGNVLVIIAVHTSRALKAPQNLFLVSLACADILVATLVVPVSLAHELMGKWYFGRVYCQIHQALDVLFCTASIAHLCAISLDRYWSVTKAIKYNLKRTPRRIKCTIFIVWVISAVISFPGPMTLDVEFGIDGMDCELNKIAKKRTRRRGAGESESEPGDASARRSKEPEPGGEHKDGGDVNGIDMEESSSSEHQPCGAAAKKLKGKGKLSRIKPGDNVSGRAAPQSRWKGRQNREKRFTFVLAVVIGVFIICWFPFFFSYTLAAVCKPCKPPDTLFKFFFWFGYCNSSLNPIIYTVFNNDFRRAFKKILCRLQRRRMI